MYSIVLPTCCCLWLTMVQVLDGKPYAGKRLSYEGVRINTCCLTLTVTILCTLFPKMDWSFGGWTPLDGGGGGGGGFTGMSSIAHHPSLTQHFSSSSPSLGLLNSNDPSSVMDSDMIQFLKQVPSSVTPPPELHGLDHQTHQSQNHNHHHHHHHHQQHNQPPQSSPSIVSQVNDSPSSSPRALRFAQSPQHKLELQHQQQQQPVSSSSPSWPSLLPVNSNNNNVSGNMPSSSSIQTAPASSSLSYAVAHDGPTKIRVEPKPLRQAQIEAYKVIEQLESDSEKQKQILSAQGPTFLPLDIPSSAEESYNSQGQAMSYSVSAPRESRRKSNSGYSNGNSLSYGSQRQTENHQTLAIPVKEIGKDYVTLPVAVETDEDKVSTSPYTSLMKYILPEKFPFVRISPTAKVLSSNMIISHLFRCQPCFYLLLFLLLFMPSVFYTCGDDHIFRLKIVDLQHLLLPSLISCSPQFEVYFWFFALTKT